MEWLAEHAWVAWLVVALVLGGVEIATLDLVFLMLAAGALGGGAAAAFGAPFLLQVLVAAAVSLAMLAVVRPVALRHLRVPAELRTGVAALVGKPAVVVEQITPTSGTVRLAGEIWTARAYDPQVTLAPGQTVDVVMIEGATAIVYGSDPS